MPRGSLSTWTLAVAAAVAGCSQGHSASPVGPADATLSHEAGAEAASPDASDAGDEPDPTEGYDGSIPFDGCAATGTCAPPIATLLATDQASPGGIALDDTFVYWVDLGFDATDLDAGRAGSQIMKCAKTGCGRNPTVLASGSWSGASKLGVSDAGVFWTLAGSVLGCPLSGCTGAPQVLWSGQGPLYDIAVDSTGVFFTSLSGQLLHCPFAGCDDGGGAIWPLLDGGSGQPNAVAVDGTRVYFIDAFQASAIVACDKTDCAGTAQVVAVPPPSTKPAQLAVDDTNVYATDIQNGGILWAPKAGSRQVLSVLVGGLVEPVGLASDGTNVYYTDTAASFSINAGRVSECATAGCGGKGRPIAAYVNRPLDVAVDDASVYWTDFGPGTDSTQSDAGRVLTVPKP